MSAAGGINFVVALTDERWHRFLSSQDGLDSVNFWQPSADNGFRALQDGELLVFLRKSPVSRIVGGGVFLRYSVLPVSRAWEYFGKGNGASSLAGLRSIISAIRDRGAEDFEIGCRILAEPFFFEEEDWIDPPEDWSKSIVAYKRYGSSSPAGGRIWAQIHERIGRARPTIEDTERFREPALIVPRLGQSAFRFEILNLYQHRCAITRERTLPALEAAHIHPYSDGGPSVATNGMLLRRDIHALYDQGYVTVDQASYVFEVSSRIREEFDNGRDYYKLHGNEISLPAEPRFWPDREALDWHNNNCFRP